MNSINPDKVLTNGQHKIASHDYPIFGPYDSSNKDVLECQLLMMKMTGIDGVIIDWYGLEDFNDYKKFHESSLILTGLIKKHNMKFAICDKDQTYKYM